MKRILLIVGPILFFANTVLAQQQEHKIVFDFTKGDTASFSTMIRQARNILNIAENTKLEVVCHGPGLDMLMKDKTTVQKEIEELQEKFNVLFAACGATMQRRAVDKSALLPQVKIVPLANLEFSSREQEGWSYIKAGYNP